MGDMQRIKHATIPITNVPDETCPFYIFSRQEQFHLCRSRYAQQPTGAWIISCGVHSDCTFFKQYAADFDECSKTEAGMSLIARDAEMNKWYVTRRFNIVKVIKRDEPGKVKVQLQTGVILPMRDDVQLFEVDEPRVVVEAQKRDILQVRPGEIMEALDEMVQEDMTRVMEESSLTIPAVVPTPVKQQSEVFIKHVGDGLVAIHGVSPEAVAQIHPMQVSHPSNDALYQHIDATPQVAQSTTTSQTEVLMAQADPKNPYRQKTWKHFVVSELRAKGPKTYKELQASALAAGVTGGDGAEKRAYDAITIACGEIRAEAKKGKNTFSVVKQEGGKQAIVDNAPAATPAV